MNDANAKAQGDTEALMARTALRYDLLPYESKPFPQSQPARIAAIAHLFGLKTAPIADARVLELGCASGGNIIPLAMRHPQAQIVGVDLSRTQVAAGRARIGALGLSNIEILCKSFTEVGDEIGKFDYIICHGVYSWVPAPVRDAILRICRERLAPEGVAYVSYNVLPGWRAPQALRDICAIALPDHGDSRLRVRQMRELLTFLSESTTDKGPYGQVLATWAARLANLPDDYVAHEFLEEINEPCAVRDFAQSAARHGLSFLGECDLALMVLENYGAAVADKVRALSNNDLVASEQYLDLLTGRTFRQTLLVGEACAARIDRALSPERIEGLHFVSAPFDLQREGDGGSIHDGGGRSFKTTSPAVIDGLARFVARFPASSTIDDCAEALSARARAEGGRDLLRDALFRMLVAGMITPLAGPATVATVAGDRPRASVIARADAAGGAEFTTNARHEPINFDPASKALLPHMDGSRDHAALAAILVEEARAGRLNFARDNQPIAMDEIAAVAGVHLPNIVAGIARAGLIEA